MFNVLFSSSVGSLCHTCTRGVVRRLMQTFENLLLQNCEQNSYILHTNSL